MMKNYKTKNQTDLVKLIMMKMKSEMAIETTNQKWLDTIQLISWLELPKQNPMRLETNKLKSQIQLKIAVHDQIQQY